MRQIGNQCRDTLHYSGYTLHKRINENEVILQAYDKVLQLWIANDQCEGYVIEIEGIGYKYSCLVDDEGNVLENSDEEPAWIDRHSVNCSKCSKLVDERDCMPLEEGGSLCQECVVPSDED